MKTVFATVVALAMCGSAMAAIEFSEEQVTSAEGGSSTGQSNSGAVKYYFASSQAMDGSAIGSDGAPLTGTTSRRDRSISSPQMLSGRGGGVGGANNGQGNNSGAPGNNSGISGPTSGADNGSTDDGSIDNGGDGSTSGPDNASVPEPATLIVWSLLAACGFGMTRARRR